MNRVILIGNLTKDPEVNEMKDNLKNCRFTVAVQRRFGAKETDYFTVVCWRSIAENVGKYVRKGSRVAVSGSIQNRSYEAQDGSKRYSMEIVADEVQFLNNRGEGGELDAGAMPVEKVDALKEEIVEDNGDLPF